MEGGKNHRAALSAAFGPSENLTEEVYDKLESLIKIFNSSPDDLYISWESYNVTEVQQDLDLTVPNIDKFQEYLQSTLESSKPTPSLKRTKDFQNSSALKRKPIIKSNIAINTSSPPVPTTPLKRNGLDDATPRFKTPRANFMESSPAHYETANNSFQSTGSGTTPIADKLAKQQDSNTIVETLNPQVKESPGFIQLEEDSASSLKPYTLGLNFDAAKFKFRTMAMKLLESADILDDQIDTFAQLYMDANKNANLEDSIQFGNPCLSTQFDILCSGRIVPDSPVYDKQQGNNYSLNATSLYLETSRMSGIGQRVPLELSNLPGYSLFPGQIVILKGSNPTGKTFIVKEILSMPELGAAVSGKVELESYEELVGKTGLKFLIASGPFSNNFNLNYSKLENLVNLINTDIKPHVVILNGPFIDINNIAVSQGDIEIPLDKQAQPPRNLDEVFKRLVTPILRKIDGRIQVILVPSLTDTCIKHCSYPQDAFDRKKFGLPKNVRVIPNPASFSINEVLIGNSNLDIFKDMKEVYKDDGKLSKNRFERVANHILQQRRYYMSLPGSIKKLIPTSKEANQKLNQLQDGIMSEELLDADIGGSTLEVPYLGLTELGDSIPDILINTSEMKSFVKVVKGVVVVNPGQYIRNHKDPNREEGTYVVVNINSPSLESKSENNIEPVDGSPDLFYHNVYKRSRVDIYKS
ncbi:DNA polymerase alpha-primase complex B subunit [Scheffersomyces coipomensis]|uniref:DNA polymerase alpha-primase complex B subunit n=1 Tax=Scheffersomyces coipomensis TaxID=1788519 RepID=UPI00315DC89A